MFFQFPLTKSKSKWKQSVCHCLQVRDDMAADGIEPLEEEIPYEDIIGRDYCRYNMKRLMGP